MIVGTLADYGPDARAWALNFGSIALQKLRGMQREAFGRVFGFNSSVCMCREALEMLHLS